MIDHYNFGSMVINGNQYDSDVILFGEAVKENWWRKKGHELCVADIDGALEEFDPEVVVAGTGKFGLMKVLPETETYLHARQIRLIAQKTSLACETYNKLLGSERVLGAFHLTC